MKVQKLLTGALIFVCIAVVALNIFANIEKHEMGTLDYPTVTLLPFRSLGVNRPGEAVPVDGIVLVVPPIKPFTW